jgi:hypothetical protein
MNGWTSNGNVGTKLFFMAGPEGTNHFVGTDAGANFLHAYLYTGLQVTGGTANLGQATVHENNLAGGGWHKMEVLWEGNTPGLRDGGYRQWVDGRLVAVATDAMYFAAGNERRWRYLWFDPTYGGGLNPVPHDQFIDFDHVVVSVK